MQPLRHGCANAIDDSLGFEQDLDIVETQHRVAAQHEPRVLIEITTTVRGSAVESETIQLDDEPFADQTVDGMPIDPHLLAQRDRRARHERSEVALETRVRQSARKAGDPCRARGVPDDSGEDLGVDDATSQCRLPDGEGIRGGETGCHMEEHIEDVLVRLEAREGDGSGRAVQPDACGIHS